LCGIAGLLAFAEEGRATHDLALKMAQAIAHRGPDAQTAWVSPSRRCALGHARLRVIDLVTGEQPMQNEDGRVQVVFNGEIYNYRLLRTELEGLGHRFRSRSDTEVIAHGFEEWGEDVAGRLDGMFAFGIWDEKTGRLTLGRDRAGKKPLYWYSGQGTFAFASEIKSLLALPFVPDAVDSGGISLYLAYGYCPGPATVYRAVHKFLPGHVATLKADGTLDSRKYWSLDFRPQQISEAEAVVGVRQRVTASVERRLESDVPLGAFLSGGLDSSVVVGLMQRMMTEPVRTFSIGFEDEPLFDETGYAREVAEHFGTEHTEFLVGAQSIDLIDTLVEAYDEPFGDSSAIPTYIVSRLTREHVTVALTGDGGDELFAGYLRFFGAQLAEAIPTPLARLGDTVGKAWPHNDNFRSFSRRVQRFFAAAAELPEERTLRWIGFFGDRLDEVLSEQVPRLPRSDVTQSFRDAFERAGGRGSTALSRALAVNFDTYLPEDLLVKADRCSMAHGLELRAPLLDTDVMEYVACLPDRLKIRRRSFKWVLKEAFRDLVPLSIIERPKQGFGIPLPQWLRGPWRPLLEERILQTGAPIGEWVRPEPVQEMARAHLEGRADFGHQLWALLTLDAWARRQNGPS
jgi:asparagine synthase (glutamine-hydrolysing)